MRARVGLIGGVVSVLLLALAVGGCGGGGASGVSPTAYVRARCTTLTAWKAAVQRTTNTLQSELPKSKSLSDAKRTYSAFVDGLVVATSHATAAMRAAGTPAVTNGDQIANRLVSAFAAAKRSLSRIARRSAAIPTTSTVAYGKAVTAVSASIRSALTAMSSISPGDSAQLQAAAAVDPACKSLVAAG